MGEAVEEMKKWLDQAPARSTTYKRATSVLRYLVTHESDSLLEFIQPVVKDKRSDVEEVLASIQRWKDRAFVIAEINRIDHELVGRRLSPIEATARRQIIRHVMEAYRLAENWCRLVRREQRLQGRGDWLIGRTQDFVQGFKDIIPQVQADLAELNADTQPTSLVALSRQLQVTLEQLRRLLRIETEKPTRPDHWYSIPTSANLFQGLSYRLLWLPECPLEDDGQPVAEALTTLSKHLRASIEEQCTMEQSFEMWLDREDYRFIDTIFDIMPDLEDEFNHLYRERLSRSRQKLDRLIRQTADEIEQALVDGVIYAEEHAELDAHVQSVSKIAATTKNFAFLYKKLQAMQNSLHSAREDCIRTQQKRWDDIKARLEQAVIQADSKALIIASVERAIDKRAIRVVDEYLAYLENTLDQGAETDHTIFREPEAKQDALRDFVDEILGLRQLLEDYSNLAHIANDIRKRKDGPHKLKSKLKIDKLPAGRLEEVADAIEAWRQLKSRRQAYNPEDQARHIATLLQYLGFRLSSPVSRAVRIVHRLDKDSSHWQADMSASRLSPVPQFGSRQEGQFDIVCIWERPGFDAIGAILRELNLQNSPTLILYFGQLFPKQREALLAFSRTESLTIAVLDEVLLLYLAREYGARLGTFLQCALPFTMSNPYVPFAAGTVPPEMFFGRRDMVRTLQEPSGPCIIYGGRQLGKSAILRQVYREFYRPEREQYALLEDIKLIGDPTAGQDTDVLWRRLRDGLVNLRLLDPRTSARPERLREEINKVMSAEPHRRILVLLDEADTFLDIDAQRNFQIVSQLKEMMDTTDRRFKVIFAGLHNVQRFQGIGNHPLAHMGTPLNVGPLDSKAAQELVQERMEPLGFRFADKTLILRILSYTNYHPGLIQLFCREVVKHLYKQKVRGLPPYEVNEDTVEAVYRDLDVQSEIRKRFEWTLALDKRYKVVALAMVLDQMEARDSFTKVYSKEELYHMAKDWWPAGFKQVERGQFQGYLEEMKGLGVLVRAKNGYRLRSPNLIRLMGTEDEMWQVLGETVSQPPDTDRQVDSHHMLIDPATNHYSPLTYAQERMLNPHRFGVGLVFGSGALGLYQLPEATKRFIPDELTHERARWAPLNVIANDGRAIERWLDKFLGQCKTHERLVVYRDLRGNPEQLADQVKAALKVCDRYSKRRDQWLRVIFAFDPISTWEWLQLPMNERESLENQVDVPIVLTRWDVVGIRQRLNQHQPELLSSDQACKAVLDATGGWHWLLDNFIKRCAGQTDPYPQAEALRRDLEQDPTSQQKFLELLGISPSSPVAQTFHFICQEEKGVPADLFVPEMLKGYVDLADQNCETILEYLERMGLVNWDGENIVAEPVAKRVCEHLSA